eukprot:TRINITY_DN3679_c0_g1_i3.p1 TRINITY_DN3679_c0_g1~~TRINITY_DN3679_c0_g1_i3.p1  ORF type:complete len:207 (+),score=-45.69 TRINITY_DN3679_c0_g1_i3:161-781(+)
MRKDQDILLAQAKLGVQVPVNVGRNYNGPKVAKFLVGQVPTCTNLVTTERLSRRGSRRNCNGGEDAACPQQDGKTLCTFTVSWYCVLVNNTQRRWETLRPQLRLWRSRNVKHHFLLIRILTSCCKPAEGQCLRVSLTGAVSSKRVTEEREGTLNLVCNQVTSVWVQECLTARPTSRADAKAGPNDPMVQCGIAIAQRTKGTLGITG